MADFGRWRDAAGEPAADRAVDTDRPEPPERASTVDGHPGLRDLYADDPDDIFDPDDTEAETHADVSPGRDADAMSNADGEPGDRPAGEPPPDRASTHAPERNGPDDPPTETADVPLTVVDRPVTPENRDGGYGMDLTLTPREGRLVRPVLFDGPPSREQAVQGDLGDCGVTGTHRR